MSRIEAATFGILVVIALVVIGVLFFTFLASQRTRDDAAEDRERAG
jgi:cbb3-type cytochrome oxidase subunit 3